MHCESNLPTAILSIFKTRTGVEDMYFVSARLRGQCCLQGNRNGIHSVVAGAEAFYQANKGRIYFNFDPSEEQRKTYRRPDEKDIADILERFNNTF